MSRRWMAFSVLFLCALVGNGAGQAGAAPASGQDAEFMNEIRLSCEKYAKEDQIPQKDVKEYVALCIRDFSEAQPTDEFPPFESEEGIVGAPSTEYIPLEKSMEMEKARPIDPPMPAGQSLTPPAPAAAKPSVPAAAKPSVPTVPAAPPPAAAKPSVPTVPAAPPPAAAKPTVPVVPNAPVESKDPKKGLAP